MEDIWVKRVEVKGKGILHNDDLYNLYCSIITTLLISSRRMRCTGKVARVGRREIHAGFWWWNLNDTDHLKDLEANKCSRYRPGCGPEGG